MRTDRAVDDDHPDGEAEPAAGSAAVATERAERRPDPRFVALGALCIVEERLGGVARTAAGMTRAVSAPVVDAVLPLVPRSVRRAVVGVVRNLDVEGRAASAAGTATAERLAEQIADHLGRDPNVLRLVEEIVERIQWQVVDTVLPVVLERLAAEPDQVRAIVQGQSRGMVDELTTTVRSRSMTGDEAVDRIVARLLRRRPTRPEAPPGDEPAGSPPPGGAWSTGV
ncbi:MAG TPA: hypothetical protein VFZ79_09035 [Acidimicrobiales bacterium]